MIKSHFHFNYYKTINMLYEDAYNSIIFRDQNRTTPNQLDEFKIQND